MKRTGTGFARKGRNTWLIVLAVIALIAESVDLYGFWSWKSFVDELAVEPNAAAERMAHGGGFACPSTLTWASQLSARNLSAADVEKIIPALHRLGRLQKRWLITDPDGPKNLARAYLLEGNVIQAIANLRGAVSRDPMSPYLHRLLAFVLRQIGDPQEVLEHLAIANGLSPGISSPPIDLLPEDQAWVQEESMRIRRELYPRRRVDEMIALAKFQRKNGKHEQAWQTLAEVGDEAEAILVSAEWLIADGDFKGAITTLDAITATILYPARIKVRAWSLIAQAQDYRGQPKLARAAAQEALRLAPDSAAPYLALAGMAERRGDLEAAFEYLRTARGIEPTDVRLLTRLAKVAEKAEHFDDARSAFERAAELDSGSPRRPADFVDYLLRRGDFMSAAMQLSQYLDRFPTDPRLLKQAERLRAEVRK